MFNKWGGLFAALGFSSWGLFLRYKALAERSLWLDEKSQLSAMVGPFKPFWERLTYGERTCFPGEYLLNYPFVRIFGANKWGIAIPHIVSTVIGFYLLYVICQRYFKTPFSTALSFAIVSLNTHLIYHAFEFRPYAVLPTLALGCFYFSEKIICRSKELSLAKKIWIGIFFTLTIMYHAYGILMVACCILYFFLCQLDQKLWRENLREHFPFAALLAVTAGPIFFWYALGNPQFSYQATSSAGMNTFDYMPNPLNGLNTFLRTVFSNLMGYKKLKFLINGILLSLLIPHRLRYKQLGFFLVLIIFPIELMLFADLHKGYWFLQRQLTWVMPLYAILIGWCWDSIICTSYDFLKEKIRKR